jgi:hypothetical protein
MKGPHRRPLPIQVNINVANDAVDKQRCRRRHIAARFFASIFFFYIIQKQFSGPRAIIVERILDIQPVHDVRLRYAVLTINGLI